MEPVIATCTKYRDAASELQVADGTEVGAGVGFDAGSEEE